MAAVTESCGELLGKETNVTPDFVEQAAGDSAAGEASRQGDRVHRTYLSSKDSARESSKRSDSSENGKKKAKDEKAPSKVVIRRLPPAMTKEVFLNQISPVPEHDYLYFVPGSPTAGNLMGFSRAYINFINQEDLFRFTETYDNYVFVDTKGQEFPAVVEFATFQRVPKQRSKKKDPLSGSIETDGAYIIFKESLEAAAAEAAKPDVTSKQHFFETEVTSGVTQEMTTTPLLEFLKQKRADRARIRDERREEKKRKDSEKKLKQRANKEKRDAEEETKEIKLLQPRDKKENNKESRNGRRSEKEKPPKEIRPREFKSRNKNYLDEKSRVDKKDDRKREGGGGGGVDKKEEKKDLPDKAAKDEVKEKVSDDATAVNVVVDKGTSRIGGSDRRRGGGAGDRKKFEGDNPKAGGEGEDGAKRVRNKSVRKERERRRREDYFAKKILEKRNNNDGGADRKKSRSFKNSHSEAHYEKLKSDVKDEKEAAMDVAKEITKGAQDGNALSRLVGEETDAKFAQNDNREQSSYTSRPSTTKNNKRRSSLELAPDAEKSSMGSGGGLKRRNSLESGQLTESGRRGSKGTKERNQERRGSRERKDNSDKHGAEKRGVESDSGGEKTSRSNRDEKASKSDQDDSKDPRTGRRIRNKDRPSIQIYRPGMGKLSKQRLEKEKTLGSSTEVDSPTHSPSPAPKAKPPS